MPFLLFDCQRQTSDFPAYLLTRCLPNRILHRIQPIPPLRHVKTTHTPHISAIFSLKWPMRRPMQHSRVVPDGDISRILPMQVKAVLLLLAMLPQLIKQCLPLLNPQALDMIRIARDIQVLPSPPFMCLHEAMTRRDAVEDIDVLEERRARICGLTIMDDGI